MSTKEDGGSGDARSDMNAARTDVMRLETEIQGIKASLRSLGEDKTMNALRISALQCTVVPMPKLKFQLSSPIEEAVLSHLEDPLVTDREEAKKGGSMVEFQEVEVSAATLTITTEKEGETSATHEVAPLCEFDVVSYLKNNAQATVAKSSQLDIAIVSNKDHDEAIAVDLTGSTFSVGEVSLVEDGEFKDCEDEETSEEKPKGGTGGEEPKAGVGEDEDLTDDADTPEATEGEAGGEDLPQAKDEGPPDDKKDADPSISRSSSSKILTPSMTVKLKIEYVPSKGDQREALFDLLNAASKSKAQAIEKLRKSAAEVARSTSKAGTASSGATQTAEKAVKSGFLNKKKTTRQPNILKRMYTKVADRKSVV